ncbi:SGNH/GDSL hydrolase family protein [Paenibacillus thalictri]|uniref:SGNH/GDSL hydrolase family protein n=1 Tax=Paenibacillus thalictri TaxID=2527873 RepID=A0A4Q9DID4_9BACL|nr:SGNH/GDSL hydrolase family protein [Paenibacillus thalictri]TBL73012.1 SGNH/GDSL hydrolase family protein [Paenibacillus thalictri]
MRILVAADSLSLPRPHRINNFNPVTENELAVHYHETYGSLIDRKLRQNNPELYIEVINRGQRSCTIKSVAEQFADHLFFFQPDVIVLQVGIVDLWYREHLGGKQYVNVHEFSVYYSRILEFIKMRPQVKLAVVGILPTSVKMDTRYSGINKQVTLYNQVLKKGADNNQVFFIDMEPDLNPKQPQQYLLPDDHHLNKAGNQLVAGKLLSLLQAIIYNVAGFQHYQQNHFDEAYSNFVSSYESFSDYADNLYNLICLAFDRNEFLLLKQIFDKIQKHNLHHTELNDLIHTVREKANL